jgi:threonylcarbamoyladenosine tRNA methylthiotransferase MtaB
VIKVQDGCSHGCTYCIIPTTRGRSVSRPPAEIVSEASACWRAASVKSPSAASTCATMAGTFRRQWISGICWRREQALSPRWQGRARLRLGSLEPGDLNAKALSTLAASRLMTPHLHVSLQSGSPEVLRRMGRGHYGPEEIFSFLEGLREIWPAFGLGADLIAGFPGETQEHARETMEVVKLLPLSYAHVFPYSERPGTPAALFKDSVPGHIRRERAKALRQEVARKRAAFLHALLQLPAMDVALEENGTGMNEFYVECSVIDAPSHARNCCASSPRDCPAPGWRPEFSHRRQREDA